MQGLPCGTTGMVRAVLHNTDARSQFNKTLTSVMYKCAHCFKSLKTIASLVNYTCKRFLHPKMEQSSIYIWFAGNHPNLYQRASQEDPDNYLKTRAQLLEAWLALTSV